MQESFSNVAGPKACNIVKMRLQHRRFPVKFDKFLRTSPVAASEFCSSGSVIIVSVSNVRCTVNQCIKVSVWSVLWYCIHSKIMWELVNGSSKNILADALSSLLVFNHCFIQISFQPWFHFIQKRTQWNLKVQSCKLYITNIWSFQHK